MLTAWRSKTRDQALIYAELNEAANRVAHAILARRGEGQEPIALLFAKGVPLIVAILGVLKAGKIYMPVDPSLPHVRMTYMLEDSQAGLIVTNNENIPLTADLVQHGRQVINIDELFPASPLRILTCLYRRRRLPIWCTRPAQPAPAQGSG